MDAAARRREWHRYYSEKRIGQQWKQLDLVGRYHEGGAILEIGPYLGLVTACLANAGYDVATLDECSRQFACPSTQHLQADLRNVDPARLADFETVLCCETFEHLPWSDVDEVLRRLLRPKRTLIVSVPYEGFQLFTQFYINRHTARQAFQWRKLRFCRQFPMPADPGPATHKWEIGYRGYSLMAWEHKLRAAGWAILARDFTAPTRSVFHVLRGHRPQPASSAARPEGD
jgi:hypothetical protein